MKYLGSKARIAKEILPIILRNRKENQYYVEPFAGGMNSICEVKGNRIANDINEYLISMWKELIKGWIPDKIGKDLYLKIRDNKENYPDYLVGWVGFNCSYSGKWFSGYAGITKTKIGTVRDYQSEAIKNCLEQVNKMKNVEFKSLYYDKLEIPTKSIIYCDPPYKGTTKNYNEFDNDKFWEWVRRMSKQGHEVYVSEYEAPTDFECIWKKEIKSSLSANGKIGGSKLSIEKLFILKR